MTRWARAGNSQRHQKIPGEATKWGEFDLQKANDTSKHPNKIKTETSSESNVKAPNMMNFSGNKNFADSSKKSKNKKKRSLVEVSDVRNKKSKSEIHSDMPSNLTPDDKVSNTQEIINSSEKSCPEQNLSVKNEKKKKRKTIEQNDVHDKKTEVSEIKSFEKKKGKYLEKLQKRRAENGILLLPSKVERKIYNIKRKLREKGLPPAYIKDIIRKERRKEELKFRKTFNPFKLCFNCRQPGHILADCPVKLGSSNQETGICFKCGSAEHSSFKCPEKVQGFPFAKCFICKEQGHISKDCPSNNHGVYPKGGQCSLCGNVNHLRKDCPTWKKKTADEEPTLTLQTINEGTSIDAEILEKPQVKRYKAKKPKIVKF